MGKVVCCLCGCEEMGEGYKDMVQCTNCNLYIKTKIPGKAATKAKLADFMLTACFNKDTEKRRIRNAERQIHNIEKFTEVGRVFDVGAAAGFFMKAALDAGWEVHGNDPSLSAVKWAKEHYNIDIHNEFMEDVVKDDDSYDAVVMWNTLEHTHDPGKTIAMAKSMLKKGGVLYIKVPEKGSLDVLKRYYEEWHFYEFNQTTLCNYLKSRGFSEKAIYHDMSGTPSTEYLFQK